MATAPKEDAVQEVDNWTKPPFLRRVRIRGYKSIAFCDVALQPLTILVGRNAAGKSNFLDALAFLRDTMNVGVAGALKRRGNWSSVVCQTLGTPKIEIDIEAAFICGSPCERLSDRNGPSAIRKPETGSPPDLTGKVFSATYSLEISTGPHSIPTISRESLDITDKTGLGCGGFEVLNGVVNCWKSQPDSPELLSISRPPARRPDFPLLSVIGTQPFAELGESLQLMGFYSFHPDAMRFLQKPRPGWLLEKDGSNLASVIEGLHEIEAESVERVRDYLTVIAEEVEGFVVARYGEYETVRFRLRGSSPERPLEFDAVAMSDGTLRALAALIAAFQMVLPLGYPGIVGIEEPETALHPAAMRALVDALEDATQRTQILLTTHSADLLSGRDVNPGQVLVVRNRGGQTYLTPVDPASREIIQKELYSLADLQRMDKLDLDEADLKRQAQLRRQDGG